MSESVVRRVYRPHGGALPKGLSRCRSGRMQTDDTDEARFRNELSSEPIQERADRL